MDGGSFRTPRPLERKTATRPDPPYRPSAESQLVEEEPKTVQRAAVSRHSENEKKPASRKRFVLPIVAIIIVIILGVAGWFLMSRPHDNATAIDGSKYQAIFFTNGQVYFGKLHAFNDEYLKMTDIFYLQTQASEETTTKDSKNPQQTATDQNNVQLIKLGQEIHGPEDEMIISRAQVLFYENLKSDSKVAQSIDQYKKQ